MAGQPGDFVPPASIVSARWAWGKLCRPVGHVENCVGLLGIGNHCRLAEP